MSVIIVSRTISALVDQKIVLANDQVARLLSIGSTWNAIRFGMRLCVDPSGSATDLAGADLRIGACSGTANKVGDATTTNFIGFYQATTLGYVAGPPAYLSQVSGSATSAVKKVGTTLTRSAFGNGFYLPDDLTRRAGCLVEITKGAPNYTVAYSVCGPSSAQFDLPYTGLIEAMQANTFGNAVAALALYSAGYSGSAALTLAFDEVAGALNAFNLYWNIASRPLEVSEVLYARIA